MRGTFATTLAELERRLRDGLRDAATTLETLADVVTVPVARRWEEIGQSARELRQLGHAADGELLALAACQAPVADDLRLVLALSRVAQHLGLIANQFGLIDEQLEAIDADPPTIPVPSERLAEMARLAAGQLRRAVVAFAARDVVAAVQVDHDDDAIDRLNRVVFDQTLALEAETHEREVALRQMLIARSLERIGDNAVDIGEQAVFLVSAQPIEFSDASHPRPGR